MKILITVLVVIALIGGILYYLGINKTDSKVFRCRDFQTQAAAQSALLAGAQYLDRNNDGIACGRLPTTGVFSYGF